MMEKRKPTLEQLSLYYDGLLDEDEARAVAAYLEENEPSRCVLSVFGDFDAALQPDLPEDQIDAWLHDNLKTIHERLALQEHRSRRPSDSIWGWILNPRNLLAGLAGILLLFGVYTVYEHTAGVAPQIAIQTPPEASSGNSLPDTEPPVEYASFSEMKAAAISEAQKGAILTIAGLAKSALSTGFEYAKETASPLGKTLESLPGNSEFGLAVNAIRSSVPQPNESAADAQTAAPNTATAALARTGTQQLALGLGTTILSLITVF